MRLLSLLARRFVAGETAAEAVRVGERLARQGIRATFDLLGEHVQDEAAARRSASANQAFLRGMPAGLEPNISVKLTQLGLDLSPDLCLELANDVVTAASDRGGFVRIDMEGSSYTQRTIDIFRRLRRDHAQVGLVLQAALFRTEQDVIEAVERGDRVRLCKGAYKERAAIAWVRMEEIRASFRRCAERLLAQGNVPAIATHDESLVRFALDCAARHGRAPGEFELQMLFGLRRRRWAELVHDGQRVRVYVPYGTHWIPYFYRRLRERKENVLFVLRHLLRG